MRHYRLFHMIGKRVDRFREIVARSDAKAIEEAMADPDCPTCEVWEDDRQVVVLE